MHSPGGLRPALAGLLLALVLLFAASAGVRAQAQFPLQARTDTGVVEGFLDTRYATVNWLGIPYAAPPTGEDRWKAPRPPAPWNGVRAARNYGPVCPQVDTDFVVFPPGTTMDEDCLTVNVWRPANSSGLLPVFVWIHGGGWTAGGSPDLRLRGQMLAARGPLVVVSFNYRLGALGWMAHPGFQDPFRGGAVGNYGLLDQELALDWIQRNIRAFGGDPTKVTLAGESAGGSAVCYHTTLQRSVFAAAIIQSGPSFWQSLSKDAAMTAGGVVASLVGCGLDSGLGAAACLRAKPWRDLVGFQVGLASTTVDGVTVRKTPWDAVKTGDYRRLPLIAGSTANETSFVVFAVWPRPVTQAEYPGILETLFGKDVGRRALQYYACGRVDAGDCRAVLQQLLSDATINCPTTLVAQAMASSSSMNGMMQGRTKDLRLNGDHHATGSRRTKEYSMTANHTTRLGTHTIHASEVVPVWSYRFDHTPSWYPRPEHGSTHAVEQDFTFGSLDFRTAPPATPSEVRFARLVSGYWARFAATVGDPNDHSGSGSGSAPAWPKYGAANGWARLALDLPANEGGRGVRGIRDWGESACAFLLSLNENGGAQREEVIRRLNELVWSRML